MLDYMVAAWEEAKPAIRARFKAGHPDSYKDILTIVVEQMNPHLADQGCGHALKVDRIHELDDGDYQGTLVFLIPFDVYQPSEYVLTKVDYGSCSACDTFQSVRYSEFGSYSEESTDAPNKLQVDQYMTLALHLVQGMKIV